MTASALISRSLGMMFTVFLSDSIGTDGVGLYRLIISVYIVFASAVTAGFSLSATRLTSESLASGKKDLAVFSAGKCILYAFAAGAAAAVIMGFSSDLTAQYIIHDVRCTVPLRILAPSLPFMAVSSSVRGYFTARRKTLPQAGEQLLEQIIEIGVFLLIFRLHSPHDLTDACCTAVFGTTAAELISFIYAMILFALDKKGMNCKNMKSTRIGLSMLPIILPVTANSLIRSGLGAAENIMIPIGLQSSGADSVSALSQYGMLSGMAMPVIVFPSVLILPFASLIIPEMSEANIKTQTGSIRIMTEKMFRLTLLYSLPVMIIMIFYADDISVCLYHNQRVGYFIAVLAPTVPLMSLDSITDGILKGLGKQTSYMIFNLIDSVIRVALTVILLPEFGIRGMLAVIIVSELLNTFMSIARLISVTKLRIMLIDWIVKPLICIIIPCIFIKAIFCRPGTEFTLAAEIVFCVAVYLLLIVFTDWIQVFLHNIIIKLRNLRNIEQSAAL